jgi:hypothetical protein
LTIIVVSGSISGLIDVSGLIGTSGLVPGNTGEVEYGIDSDKLGLARPSRGSLVGGSESCTGSGSGVEPGVGVFSGVIRARFSGFSILELVPD